MSSHKRKLFDDIVVAFNCDDGGSNVGNDDGSNRWDLGQAVCLFRTK